MSPVLAPTGRGRFLRLGLALCALLLVVSTASTAHAFRLLSWNVLNYPTASGSTREDDLRAVIGAIGPDIVVCQEIVGFTGATQFQGNVLNVLEPGQWTRATFSNSNDTERALYFRTSDFNEVSHGQLPTSPRTIDWWRLRPTGYSAAAAELVVYSVHLKASQGGDNETERNAAAILLRAHLETLPADTNFIVAGDYNIYSSSEPAWSTLTDSQGANAGRLFDPINRVGSWHTNSSFSDVHTQSTRLTNLSDGGSSGGMDDRFDFILANDNLLDNEGFDLEVNTYTAYGQDGLHYNTSINASPTNAAVGQTMANHLQAASDHLPVYADFQLPSRLDATVDLDFGPVLQGALTGRAVNIANSAVAGSDDLDVVLGIASPFLAVPTVFGVLAAASSNPTVNLDTSTTGNFSVQLAVSTDAPDTPLEFFPATATVVRPSVPSLEAGSVVVGTQVDFGTHPVGDFTNQTVDVFNLGHDALQAGLEVFDAEFDGPDAARFSLTGFTPSVVGGTPLTLTLVFDDTDGSESVTYTAQLVLSTQDDSAVSGGAARAALVLDLEAVVESQGVAVPLVPTGQFRLMPNVPNPFNPRTDIRFELAREGRVQLVVYSAQGRVVRTLADEVFSPGVHVRTWDGRAQDGREVASGVYFVRMRSVEGTRVRRAVLVR